MPSKNKRKRIQERRPTIHPRNKCSSKPPDFKLLASLYSNFEPFVFYSGNGYPNIDWTDFNATRELTRVLLHHDHGVNWWIPDGQLCPTVPNRSNYIHWIEDLLSSEVIAKSNASGDKVRGFDIGTGANCIYPLLGASLLGWNFVGSDVTDVALEWAEINVKSNPHLSELIEIRNSGPSHTPLKEEASNGETPTIEAKPNLGETVEDPKSLVDKSLGIVCSDVKCDSPGPNVLLGVVKENEYFDFCMCNPPFFDSMSEAGLNPKTACGGTPEEMVCPGGEQAFITHIIEDSAVLKQSFRWYTSMIGRKSNLKILTSKLWEVGVSIVKTTEFVQGETCRWGLAWSFMPPAKKIVASYIAEKNNLKSNLSFMLEGLQRQFSAIHVLKSVESYFLTSGGSCKTDLTLYVVDVTASSEYCDAIQNDMARNSDTRMSCRLACNLSNVSNPLDELRFRISVFQQIPGTLLVRGSLQHKESPLAGIFSLAFQKLEEVLKQEFCREKMPIGPCHPT